MFNGKLLLSHHALIRSTIQSLMLWYRVGEINWLETCRKDSWKQFHLIELWWLISILIFRWWNGFLGNKILENKNSEYFKEYSEIIAGVCRYFNYELTSPGLLLDAKWCFSIPSDKTYCPCGRLPLAPQGLTCWYPMALSSGAWHFWGLPAGTVVKNPPAKAKHKRCGLDPWV